MPVGRKDARLLIVAGALAVVGGLVVAAVLLIATGGRSGPAEYRPFAAGPEFDLRRELRKGGPFYVPDPFGGNRSILWSLEDDQVVPLAVHTAGDRTCRVIWRGRVDSFEDCDDNRLTSDEIPRYRSRVPASGANEGIVLVDLARPPPPAESVAGLRTQLLQRGPGEQQALLTHIAEPDDGLGAVALADHVDDHALAEGLVADVVADAQPEPARRRARRPRRRRHRRCSAAAAASELAVHARAPRPVGRSAPRTWTSSSGISVRKRLGG